MSGQSVHGMWKKLSNGSWGVSYFPKKSGETITVAKKDGTTSKVTLSTEISTGSYEIISQKSSSYSHRTREEWSELIMEQDCDCTHYITSKRPCDCGEI